MAFLLLRILAFSSYCGINSSAMVTLLDILSLPSCGFSSVRKNIDAEVKKAYLMLTGRSLDTLNEAIMDELIMKIKKSKRGKDRFVKLEANWLARQRLVSFQSYIY